jgi:hypothetical protein
MRNEMRKSLEGHRVAIVNERCDGVAQRLKLFHDGQGS